MNINNGCIMIARKIQESDIWKKPSDWLKIWIYILQEVNHKDNKIFKRGENLFNYQDVARECGVKYNSVVKFIKWAKLATLVATHKTTRGAVIIVLKYNDYQTLENYRGNTSGNTSGKIEARQKQDRSHTIIEERKERKEREESTNVDEAVPQRGNPEVNKILKALKVKIQIEHFVDSSIERNMAKHCVGLMEKIGTEEFVKRLEFLLQDPFHNKNCNKIKYVYNNIKGFKESGVDISKYII